MQNYNAILSLVAERALAVALAVCSTFAIGSIRIYQQHTNGGNLEQVSTKDAATIPHQAALWNE